PSLNPRTTLTLMLLITIRIAFTSISLITIRATFTSTSLITTLTSKSLITMLTSKSLITTQSIMTLQKDDYHVKVVHHNTLVFFPLIIINLDFVCFFD